MPEQVWAEKRQFKRSLLKTPVQFFLKNESQSSGSTACDISTDGMRIRVFDFIPMDAELTLQVQLKNDRCVGLRGRIVWIQRIPFSEYYEAGLKFVEASTTLNSRRMIYGEIASA